MKPIKATHDPTDNQELQSPLSWLHLALAATVTYTSLIGLTQSSLPLLERNFAWQYILHTTVSGVSFVLSLVVFERVFHNYPETAGYLSLGLILTNGIVGTFLFSNIGLETQILVTLAGILVALEMIPYAHRTLSIIASIVAGFVAFGLDLFQPPWRLAVQYPANIYFVTILIGLFAFYIFRGFQHYTLQTRFLLVTMGINLLAAFLIALATTYFSRQIVSQSTTQKLNVASASLAKEIDEYFQFQVTELRTKADTQTLKDFLRLPSEERAGSKLEETTLELLQTWQGQDPAVESYALLDTMGFNVLDTVPEDKGKNESSFEFYKQPLQSLHHYISPVYYLSEGHPILTISMPIVDPRGIVGVLRVHIRAEILQFYVETYTEKFGVQSFATLLDDQGILLAHGKNPELNFLPLAGLNEAEIQRLQLSHRLPEATEWLDLPELRKLLASSKEKSFETFIITPGEPVLGIASAAPLSQQNWQVVLFQPVEYAFLPVRQLTNTILVVTEVMSLLVLGLGFVSARHFTQPIRVLNQAATEFNQGKLNVQVDLSNKDETGALADAFNTMVIQIRNMLEGLEERIRERTRAIEISAEISRRISTILEVEELMREVTHQLKFAFQYDHVLIYLVDEELEILRLAGAASPRGEELLKKGHFVPIGLGLVGRAAKNKSVILAPDVSKEADWLPNPSLFETSSEAVVPILLGKDVLGVIDVQQRNKDSLTTQDTDLLQLIASQIATALRNAQIMQATQQRAEQETRLSEIITQIRNTLDIERSLKVSAREIGRVANASSVLIRLKRKPF